MSRLTLLFFGAAKDIPEAAETVTAGLILYLLRKSKRSSKTASEAEASGNFEGPRTADLKCRREPAARPAAAQHEVQHRD
ncbi:MAG TPA: hypothetical protein VG672_24310, partial [Bryobacteraceae bacterium]|nr:hypothetical protein [Bryobacteraceae bacterium]